MKKMLNILILTLCINLKQIKHLNSLVAPKNPNLNKVVHNFLSLIVAV